MVSFEAVVGVLLGVVKRLRELFFDHRFERLGEIGDDLDWFVVGKQRGPKERPGCRDVAAFRYEHVDDNCRQLGE